MSTLFDLTTPVPVPAPAAGAGPRPLVIGLDVALVTTGVAGPGWTDTIRTGTRRGEQRLLCIVQTAASFYRNADFVVVEGAAFSRSLNTGGDELAAARWMIRCDLLKRGIPCAVVNPHSRSIYATGRARWKDESSLQVKGRVRDAVADRYGVECVGRHRYDEADAYILMAMGMDHLGHTLAKVPDTHGRALAGVAWPDTAGVAA